MKLLIGTDGSSGAEDAIRFVRRMPLPRPVDAMVVSVCHGTRESLLGSLVRHRDAARLLRDIRSKQAAQALRRTQSAEELLEAPGWTVSRSVREGNTSERLLHSAREWGADLMVVGASGRNGSGISILGSVTKRLLRLAPCSVLVAKTTRVQDPEQPADAPFNVLLAFDGSVHAREAVHFIEQMPPEAKVRVSALRVEPDPPRVPRPDTEHIFSILTREGMKEAEDGVERVRRTLEDAGHRAIAKIRRGKPLREILTEIEEERPDLLVVGCLGSSGRETFQIGSVSSRLAHYASCSVLVVRPEVSERLQRPIARSGNSGRSGLMA